MDTIAAIGRRWRVERRDPEPLPDRF